MELGRAVLTAIVQNAPCIRRGFVETILKWRYYSPPATTPFDAARRRAWKIAR